MQIVNGIGHFFRRFFRFVKPLLYSGEKVVDKEALKQIVISRPIYLVNNKAVGDIFKTRNSEA
jgi:hypothetical protein